MHARPATSVAPSSNFVAGSSSIAPGMMPRSAGSSSCHAAGLISRQRRQRPTRESGAARASVAQRSIEPDARRVVVGSRPMADPESSPEDRRRTRRTKMLVASIGVVILLAYGLLIRLPPVLIDRAAEKGI